MPVNIRAKVMVSDKLKDAMRQSPKIVSEELAEGMREIKVIQDQVEAQIQSAGLVKTGRFLRGVRAVVFKNPDAMNVKGVVDVRARGRGGGSYAAIHEHGGTILPKKGKWMTFRSKERALITHWQTRSGKWKEMKRPKMQTISDRWVKVDKVEIKPRWYFRRGLRKGQPHVEQALSQAGERAVQRVFEGE